MSLAMTAGLAPEEGPVDDTWHLDDLVARLGLSAARRPQRVQLSTDDGELSALDWLGEDETPEFLFVHGGGLNAHAWDSTVLHLNRPARAIDLPGHGWSEWRSDSDYRPSTMAGPVAAVSPRDQPFVLVGHSLGGLTSLMALRRMEPRPAAFVLVDMTPVAMGRSGQPPRGIHEPDLSFASHDEAIDWAISLGLGRSRESLAVGIGFNTRRRTDGRYVFRHHLAHLPLTAERFDRNEAPFWAAFDPQVPTVLVQAGRGLVTDEQVQTVLEHAPWVRVEQVDSGHNVHSQAPEALAGILADLLD